MIELSKERMEKILYEETAKREEVSTILRSIYTRYMHLYEKYFADIDALNDEKIAELSKYHEETRSLIKYYYLDIPLEICMGIKEFDHEYSEKLLGAGWHKYLFDRYEEFKETGAGGNKREEARKAEFAEQTLSAFYDAMDYLFRDSFGTNSESAKDMVDGIIGLLFGKKGDE